MRRLAETVRVYGTSQPGVLQGRIGIVVRRDADRWTANRCDVVPGWRMANALHGRQPCPKPGVRIAAVRIDGRVAQGHLAALRRRHHAAARLGPEGPAPAVLPAGNGHDRRGLHLFGAREIPREDPRRGRLRAGLWHGPKAYSTAEKTIVIR